MSRRLVADSIRSPWLTFLAVIVPDTGEYSVTIFRASRVLASSDDLRFGHVLKEEPPRRRFDELFRVGRHVRLTIAATRARWSSATRYSRWLARSSGE